MGTIVHDSSASPLFVNPYSYESFEERIAELVEQQRVELRLGNTGWWAFPQVNEMADKWTLHLKVKATYHNWHLFVRNAWYWKDTQGDWEAWKDQIVLIPARFGPPQGRAIGAC